MNVDNNLGEDIFAGGGGVTRLPVAPPRYYMCTLYNVHDVGSKNGLFEICLNNIVCISKK